MTVKGWDVVFRGDRLHADVLAAVLEAHGIKVEVFGDTGYSVAVNFTEARLFELDSEKEREAPRVSFS